MSNTGWINLNKKVVIVTGGASGIGAKIAQNLHDNNSIVVISDLRESEECKTNSDLFIQCDITNKNSVELMVQTVIEKYGRVDALVNNAGVNRPRLLVDHYKKNNAYEASEEDFDFIVNVNQKGPFFMCSGCRKAHDRKPTWCHC